MIFLKGGGLSSPAKRTEIYKPTPDDVVRTGNGHWRISEHGSWLLRDWVQGFASNSLDAGDTEWLHRLWKENA